MSVGGTGVGRVLVTKAAAGEFVGAGDCAVRRLAAGRSPAKPMIRGRAGVIGQLVKWGPRGFRDPRPVRVFHKIARKN